ncbi:YoaK family protein [Bradyrhizobium yuanmingense]|uniref:YoaK family protein n=1 Tax=Bradyrhizobium yuanmingense TaxID=108015 RepID=UPI0023B9842F|nr:YoaK family protein [Bradyrhizobium yuanmingense]MDF0492244.1 YoaK family protein [Bradyrhizobium yuanmingense]MDF0518586.1 YoaK family protein [Bradyrhizobium yuanmingense]MDF0579723.1 YoaK family protein [Bradyrhizobium yuanmingense]
MLSGLRNKGNSAVLAFVSGFVDALFFIHLGGLFVGLVTGNVVLIGLGLVGHEKGGLRDLQLMTFPIFMLGAGVATLMVARIKPLQRATVCVIGLSACAFAVSAGLAIWHTHVNSACALFTVAAMGMLTAIDRLDARLGPPFSLMTGNVAGLAIATTRRLIGYTERPDEWAQSLTATMLVFAFVAGCAAGAFTQVTVGVAGMFFPALLLLLIALLYSPQIDQQ